MRCAFARLFCLSIVLVIAKPALAQQPDDAPEEQRTELKTIDEVTEGLTQLDGLLTLYVDKTRGRILLLVPQVSADRDHSDDLLHVDSIRTGLGSNPVGLDRGRLGRERIVYFRRMTDRVLLIERNLKFRASSDDSAEQQAVEESFARSVLWAGKVEARDDAGRVMVDFSSFLLRTPRDMLDALRDADQGTFTFDKSRSAVDLDAALAFPDNVAFESLLTVTSEKPGRLVRAVAPDGNAVSLVRHDSFVRLPDDDYTPRRFDPRGPAACRAAPRSRAVPRPGRRRSRLFRACRRPA